MPSFKVKCPSCEDQVLIKNPNLVGTKVECPKCKYRFKVEEPKAEEAGKDGGKDAKSADKEKKDKKEKAGGKKKLVPIIAGVVGLAVLIGVGVAVVGKPSKKVDPFAGLGKKGGSGDGTGDGTDTEPKDKEGKVEPAKQAVSGTDKVTTNLLPGKTNGVYRLNLDGSAGLRNTPVQQALLDAATQDAMKRTLGFDAGAVETYIHCFVGPDREPVGVLKMRGAEAAGDRLARMPIVPKAQKIKGRDLYEFKAAPFLVAVSQALAPRSFFADLLAAGPPAPAPTAGKAAAYGVCIYDNQHVLIGELKTLAAFLNDFGPAGYPPYQTERLAADDRDTYRTLDPKLKEELDFLERGGNPMALFVERFDAPPALAALPLFALLDQVKYLSGNVTLFTTRRLVANLHLRFAGPAAALPAAKDTFSPKLANGVESLKALLLTPIEFRDYANGYTPSTGMPPTGTPPSSMPPSSMPPSSMPPSSMPPSSMPPVGLTPAGGGRGSGSGGGSSDEGMGGGPGVIPGVNPGGTTGQPVVEGPPASHIDLTPLDARVLIAVDVTWPEEAYREIVTPRLTGLGNQIKGKIAVLTADYGPHLLAAVGPKALASASQSTPRGTFDRRRTGDGVDPGLEEFPPESRVSLFVDLLPYLGRTGLQQRVNPGMGWYEVSYYDPDPKAPLAPRRVKHDNRIAGGEWVPELLVPYYPPSAWRAASPHAPDHTFGATNYVAVAGVDAVLGGVRRTAARLDPNNKDHAKLIGMTGYGWGSKASDVTDGLSNTIYMLQTPPKTVQQPWIAGGGATVRGLDPDNPMRALAHTHAGQTGTFALMGDGSVRFVPAGIDPKVLLGMATRAGGEVLGELDAAAPLVPKPGAAPKPVEKKPEDKKPDEEKKPADKKDEGKGPVDKKDKDEGKKDEAKGAPAPEPREKK